MITIQNPGEFIDSTIPSKKLGDTNKQNVLRSQCNGFKSELSTQDDIKIISTYFLDGSKHSSFFKGDVFALDQINGLLVSELSADIYYSSTSDIKYYKIYSGSTRALIKMVGAKNDPTFLNTEMTPIITTGELDGLTEDEISEMILDELNVLSIRGTIDTKSENITKIWDLEINDELKTYEVTAESKDGHKFIFRTNASENQQQNILDSLMVSKGWTEYEYKIKNSREIVETEND